MNCNFCIASAKGRMTIARFLKTSGFDNNFLHDHEDEGIHDIIGDIFISFEEHEEVVMGGIPTLILIRSDDRTV